MGAQEGFTDWWMDPDLGVLFRIFLPQWQPIPAGSTSLRWPVALGTHLTLGIAGIWDSECPPGQERTMAQAVPCPALRPVGV